MYRKANTCNQKLYLTCKAGVKTTKSIHSLYLFRTSLGENRSNLNSDFFLIFLYHEALRQAGTQSDTQADQNLSSQHV